MIREASIKDVSSIVTLWSEFMSEHDEMVLSKNEKLKNYTPKKDNASNNYREFISKHIKQGTGTIFLAEEEEIIGFILLIIKDEIPIFKIEKIGYGSDLFIKKEYRNQKISSKLMDEAIKWFKKKNIRYISLGLYCDNKHAHSVYKKKGFFDYKLEMRKEILK